MTTSEPFIQAITHERAGFYIERGGRLRLFCFNLGPHGAVYVPGDPKEVENISRIATAHGLDLGEFVADRSELSSTIVHWFYPPYLQSAARGFKYTLSAWLSEHSTPVLLAAAE